MLGAWFDQPPLVRFLLALAVCGLTGIIWFTGYFWPWGFVVGGIMLIGSIPGPEDKSDYNF